MENKKKNYQLEQYFFAVEYCKVSRNENKHGHMEKINGPVNPRYIPALKMLKNMSENDKKYQDELSIVKTVISFCHNMSPLFH